MKYIIAIILFAYNAPIISQVTEEWTSRYNGPLNASDGASSIAVDESGNIYVTGASDGIGTGSDYATIKYNSAGVQQWVARYNGLGNAGDNARSIAIDASGNVYVTGNSFGNGTLYDYATVKYNSAGSQQWAARYNGPGNGDEDAFSIAVDVQGNVYVTGWSYGGQASGQDYTTIKYNSSGVQQWVARYTAPDYTDDKPSSIVVDGSGNVYVTGFTWGSETASDYTTIKYNSEGVQQWVAIYNGPANSYDAASSIAVIGSGDVYVTGDSPGNGTSLDYSTIKYNSSGVEQWVARYNGPGNSGDQAYSIAVDGSGNAYITGRSVGDNTDYDYATVKYNSSGVQQWVAMYNGTGNDGDYASSIVLDDSDNVYVTGWELRGQANGHDYATIKYNSSGVQQWVARYNGPGSGTDWAFSIAVDVSGNVYVTGRSWGGGTSSDYATIKYSQMSTGVYQTNSEVPQEYFLLQNYPNPFNPSTTIRFAVKERSNVKLVVFNLLGQRVATLVNEELDAGWYETHFNPGNLASGVYVYRIIANQFVQCRKMLLLK